MSSTVDNNPLRISYTGPTILGPVPADGETGPDAPLFDITGASSRLFEQRFYGQSQRYDLESRLPTTTTVASYAAAPTAAPPTDIEAEKRELLLDIAQIALAVVGIFEPTPFADGADGLISLFRGDFWGAGISAVGMVPYIGDLAKLGKLPKFLRVIDRAVTIARTDSRFAEALRPALAKLREALDAVPLDSLPASARREIEALKSKIDDFFAAERRNVNTHENLGGHTIERHVGRSENWLRQRLASDPDLRFASSFRNEAAANRTQGQFVKQHRAEIDEWLRSGSQRPFTGEVTMGDPVGIVVERGRSGAVQTNRAQVVIVRDQSAQGWHILTSYPVK